ncbi:glycoside hydrolase family 127 protein [Actinophytocola xanthii]|uniref:glycoside hydrolase family 127 protein n=1 Tax=Actinophytocola xanthii TaxID=1912961 RepID=UPI000A9F78E5|nr:beta-L-arabinofuranosidase domain-containing protein [Actinophytocola xanthii]
MTSEPDPTGGRPVVPGRGALRPLGLGEVRLTGGFWAGRQEVNGTATLDHGRAWMDKLGWTGHFETTARGLTAEPGERRGREFTDSEVYKLMEAMAWEIGRTGDGDRAAELAELTALVAAAQDPDGYLNTAFGGRGQRPRYSDLAGGHELYCTGHLLQAAVAAARTAGRHGQDSLPGVARRAADHVCDAFGPHGIPAVCGHPEIEPALVELARVTGEQRYLDQAALFVRRRGHRSLPETRFGWSYFQDDVPVRRAEVLRGHAVRALYLSCGAVDLAVETGDDELLGAVAAQFARTLERRTYLTGGMGSRHTDEAFGEDFVLPADRAYSETCAGVATVMLAWRLLLATGEVGYADVIERVLYNVVATSIGDDGRSFFYANTLHQRERAEPAPADREQPQFAAGGRVPWFEVSCCLPNLARLLAGLGCYLATVDGDRVQLHQYADAVVRTRLDDGRAVGLRVRTDYPDGGTVAVRVTETTGGPWALALRVPAWAEGALLDGRPAAPGTAVVRRAFAVGDEVRLELPTSPRWTFPDPRIDGVRGCAAVERGPVVLCAESAGEDGADLDALTVDVSTPPQDTPDGVAVCGRFTAPADGGWPYRSTPAPPAGEAVDPIRLVAYHRWARRGPSTMRVWLPHT